MIGLLFSNLKEIRTDTVNIVKKEIDSLEFTEDYIFTSPSLAAAIVMGRNANGLEEWKLKDGKTLKEYETNVKRI